MKSEDDDRAYEETVPVHDRMDATLAEADYRVLLEQAIRKLPKAQRVPLVLYHLDGLRYEEIAAKLNVSLGKVKTDIFRGREALRKKLRIDLAGEEGWEEYGGKAAPRAPEPRQQQRDRLMMSSRLAPTPA